MTLKNIYWASGKMKIDSSYNIEQQRQDRWRRLAGDIGGVNGAKYACTCTLGKEFYNAKIIQSIIASLIPSIYKIVKNMCCESNAFAVRYLACVWAFCQR